MGERPKLHRHGFVYILSNDAFPGLLKVGMTYVSPEARCAEISQAMPSPCKVEYFERVLHARDAEGRAHYLLDEYRERGEWFRVDLETAKWMVYRATRSGAIEDVVMVGLKRAAAL